MPFSFADFVPDLDAEGWAGLLIGFFGSFIILSLVHRFTIDVRKHQKNESMWTYEQLEASSSRRLEIMANGIPPMDSKEEVDEVKPKSPRYCFIDCARGLAISFVTFFHYIWNLRHNHVLGSEPRVPDSHDFFLEIVDFWIFFGVCFIILSEIFHASVYMGYIGFTFVTATCIMWHYWAAQASGVGIIMFCVGISSYVQNKDGIKWVKIFSRIKKLFIVSLCITVVTYIFLPDEFVYFGAIHCITLVSILHLPFLKFPQLAIVGTVGIFSYKALLGEFPLEVKVFRNTVDHMPWFENLGYLLFGIFCGFIGMHNATHYIRCMWGRLTHGIHLEDTVFPYLGRHSLMIFIAHQVVLFPLVKLVTGNSLI
jgi:uncharacterized membrane protein